MAGIESVDTEKSKIEGGRMKEWPADFAESRAPVLAVFCVLCGKKNRFT
jgi:hypothetical protein